ARRGLPGAGQGQQAVRLQDERTAAGGRVAAATVLLAGGHRRSGAQAVERVSVYTKIQSGAAASDRIFSFMDRQPRVRLNSEGPNLPRHSRDIEFRDVCFSYEPGTSVLSGVHLHVQHGETIAI